jgi:O-antigen/teichoic acid export membrane protein
VLFSLTALALHWQFAFVDRLLPLVPLAGFLVAGVLMNLSQAMSAYLRAHKQEPMFLMSICTSLLTGLLVWLLGRRFGANGAAWSYAAVLVIGLVWQYRIWQRSRTSWHA